MEDRSFFAEMSVKVEDVYRAQQDFSAYLPSIGCFHAIIYLLKFLDTDHGDSKLGGIGAGTAPHS